MTDPQRARVIADATNCASLAREISTRARESGDVVSEALADHIVAALVALAFEAMAPDP